MATGAERALETNDCVCGADIHREIESLGGRGVRQAGESELEPPLPPVDFYCGVAGQRRDVESGILARGNSEVGGAAGIGRVRRVAAFVEQYAIDGDQKFRRVRVMDGG